MHKVAVIGPLGAGKSEILRICAEKDFPTVSADSIARMLIEMPGIARDDVIKEFPYVIGADGRIDRRKLAEEVFANYEKLKTLESIIHPHVWQVVASFFMECENKGEQVCFVEVTAPDETISQRFDEMWCAVADYEVRKARCVARGMTPEDFVARDRYQMEHINFSELATREIENSSSTGELEQIISTYLSDLTEIREPH